MKNENMRYDQSDYDALLRSAIPASLVSIESMNFDPCSLQESLIMLRHRLMT